MATNSSLALHPRDLTATASQAKAAQAKPAHKAMRTSVLRRVLDAFVSARQRQADDMVARYLARTGMKFTDSVERDIERLLAGDDQKLR